MKPVKNRRTLGVGCVILVSCVLASCTAQQRTQTHSGEATLSDKESQWKGFEPTRIEKLVIAGDDGRGYTFTNLVTISEPAFVQSLYQDLASRESLPARRILWIYPKLLIFSDGENNMLCSFLYWPAGRPEHIFTPCKARRSGDGYRVEWPSSRTPCITLPGFDERIRAYLDMWK